MKIKKIEISAFRIYDNPNDGTFDFSFSNKEVADFVSIYAPNGFGKTSFYDAVEWGMTGNIQRFWQHEEITDQAISALNSLQINRKVWRHTDSQFQTYVKIFNEANEPIERNLAISNRYKTDAKNGTVEREDFRRVILSQDWISAFLRDINGIDRYKTFMKNPDLEKLASYFKNLKVLLTICNETINDYKRQIDFRNKEIIANQESNLLEQISSTIDVLKSMEQDIVSPSLDMNELDLLNFKNKITDEKQRINPGLLDQQISNIRTAKIGSDEITSIDKYFDSIEQLNIENKKIEFYKTQIAKFDDLSKQQQERDRLQALRIETNQLIEQIEAILILFPEYRRVDKLLSEKFSFLQNIQINRSTLQNQFHAQNQLFSDKRNELQVLSGQIDNLKLNAANALIIKSEIDNEEEWLATLYTGIGPIEYLIYELSNGLNSLESQLQQYKNTIIQIRNSEFEKINKELYKEITNKFEELINLTRQSSDRNEELAHVENNLSNLESMNLSLKELLQKGVELINDGQLTDCPLCNQTYNSYSELLNRITSNNVIENNILLLLSQKSSLIQQIESTNKKISDNKDLLLSYFTERHDSTILRLNDHQTLLNNINNQLVEINQLIHVTETNIYKKKVQFENKTFEEYVAYLNSLITNSTQQQEHLNAERDNVERGLLDLQKEIQLNQSRIILAEEEISQLKKDSNYNTISDWFFNEAPTHEISEAVVNSRIISTNEILTSHNTRLDKIIQTINELSIELELTSREDVEKHLAATTELVTQAEKDINKYDAFLNLNLGISNIPTIKQDLIVILDTKLNSFQDEVSRRKLILEQYEKLTAYTENLIPFLRIANYKEEIVATEVEVNFLEEKVKRELEDEIGNVKEQLERKVEQFFYIDLINSIYNKIDPHPTYKKVDFKVNLDADDPSLDIYVLDETPNKRLIPNLYFSTAQINILSLSIFLASALNSNTYNCILIDDPIQSLDSINILSTIDLLRSIVINHGRQIILSTHDENFHKLLARKIPSELFKSKFIELETFGKVKRDMTQ